MKLMPGLGDRLRVERERLGLTQLDVATTLDMGRRTVINHEQEAHPVPLEYIDKLSRLGADAYFLLFGCRRADIAHVPDVEVLTTVVEWATVLCKDRKGKPFAPERTARFMAAAYAYLARDVDSQRAKPNTELELLDILRRVA